MCTLSYGDCGKYSGQLLTVFYQIEAIFQGWKKKLFILKMSFKKFAKI
jgi:hypothetical protein